MAESRAELLARAVQIRDEHRTNANTPARVGGALYQMVSSMAFDEFDVTAGPFLADPTGLTDSTEAFQAAMEAASTARGKVLVPRGTYMLSDRLLLEDNCYLNMELRDATLDFSTATGIPGRDACINIGTATANASTSTAGLTLLPALGANANALDQQVTFLTAPSLSAGDLFIIQNTDSFSWNTNLIDARPYYKAGDFLRARNVSGSVVQIDSQLYDTYLLAGNISLWRLQPNYAWIYGVGKVICPDNITAGIHYNNVYRGLVRDITIVNCPGTALEFWRCYETIADNVHTEALWVEAPVAIGDAVSVGCSMNASYDTWLVGGSFKANKHGLTITGGNLYAAIPNRLCGAIGSTLRADVDAADQHGHVEHCGFYECQIYGGARPGGNHSTIKGNTIFTCGDIYEQNFGGLGIGFRELKGCSHTITNNEIVVGQTRGADTYPIDLNFYEATLGGKTVVRGNKIRSKSYNALVMNIEITESEDLVEVEVDGLTYDGETGDKAPAIRLNTGATGAFKSVLIKNTTGLSPQCDGGGVRTRSIEYNGVKCSNSDTYGAILAVRAYVGVLPMMKLIGCDLSGNDEAGAFITGGAAANGATCIISGGEAINNGQDSGAGGSDRTSYKVSELKELHYGAAPSIGDTQAVATQQGLVAIENVTTISGGPVRFVGSLNYGSGVNMRSLSGVTNDLEIVELIGSGSPVSSVYGSPGWTYTRTDGTKWTKATGSATTTGWRQVVTLEQPTSALTLVSDAITITGGVHTVDTEAAAASDNLNFIGGGVPNQLLVLSPVHTDRSIVVVAGGNIVVSTAGSFTMDNSNDRIVLIADSTATFWYEICRSNNGA